MLITVYTLTIGTFFLGVGFLLFFVRKVFASFLQTFCRNKLAGMVLSTVDLVLTYFLLREMPMGFLDSYKWILIPLLPIAVVLVNMYLNELLFSRSFGGLLLIVMAPVLDVARMNFSIFTPVLSLACYILIVVGVYLVCLPYLMRDFGSIIERSNGVAKTLSIGILSYGTALVVVSFLF